MTPTLLPEHYVKIVHREKTIRSILVLIIGMIFVGIVGIIFMLPSYFALILSKTDVLRRLSIQEETLRRQDIKALEANIGRINVLVAAHQRNDALRHSLANVLARIGEIDTSSIALGRIALGRQKDGNFVITLDGTARVREAFLAYADALEKAPEVASIESPVSNLLREIDAPFILNVLIKKDIYFYAEKP